MRARSDLDGRLVFITGGAGGIGYGMARAFAREGARIVSVLCPGLVSTDLISGNAERAPSGVSLGEHEPELEEAMRQALDPFEVGQAVVRGIYEGRFWLFTHPDLSTPLEERFNEILG